MRPVSTSQVVTRPKEFADLLRSYRYLSGLSTLQDLSDALNDEGIFLGISELSRWQTGKRQPKDRQVILTILKVFIKANAVTSTHQADVLCEAAGMGCLTTQEKEALFTHKFKTLNLDDIQRVDTLSNYYLQFLAQSQAGNMLFYPEIESEYEHISLVFTEAYQLKFYQRVIAMWPYWGCFLKDSGRWQEYELGALKVISSAFLLNSRTTLARVFAEDLAWLYFWQNNVSKSEDALKSAAQFLGSDHHSENYHIYLLRSGLFNSKRHNHQVSLEQLQQARTFFEVQDNQPLVAKAELYLGHVFQDKGELTKAQLAYSQSLQRAKHLETEDYAKALYYLGEVAQLNHQDDKAIALFSQAAAQDKKNHRPAGIAWSSLGLAKSSKPQQRTQHALVAAHIFTDLKMTNQAQEAKKLLTP